MRAFVLVPLLAACGAKPNPAYCDHHPGDHAYCPWLDSGIDIDSSPDASALCVGVAPFAVCVDPPAGPLMLMGDLDSDLASECASTQPATWKAAGQSHACFVVGTTLKLDMVVA